MKKRDTISICTVHNKFQTVSGRWLNKSEDFDRHIKDSGSEDASFIETPCDECDNNLQLMIDFHAW
jgi:hypothetical protein